MYAVKYPIVLLLHHITYTLNEINIMIKIISLVEIKKINYHDQSSAWKCMGDDVSEFLAPITCILV